MADKMQLTSPLVRVILQSDLDGDEVGSRTLQTTNPDMILWERTRVKHKWPAFDEAPIMWLTFLAWAAARRTKAIPLTVTWEQWQADVLDVSGEVEDDEDDDEDLAGRPTLPGPDPG